MVELVLLKLKCLRCGRKWIPRLRNPVMCPGCKSRYWNVPKKAKGV